MGCFRRHHAIAAGRGQRAVKIGARMIIPVGPVGGYQTLWKVTKVSEDEVRTENLGAVGFVPLTREER